MSLDVLHVTTLKLTFEKFYLMLKTANSENIKLMQEFLKSRLTTKCTACHDVRADF